MVRASICVLVCLLLLNCAHAQQKGSVEAARRGRINEENARQVQERYVNATKISVIKDIPKEARHGIQNMNALNAIGVLIEDWELAVVSVVDDDEMIVGGFDDRLLWLEGYPTKEFVDDQQVRVIGPIKVTGTKTYTNVEGSSVKVKTVKLLPLEEVAELDRIAKEAEEAKLYRTFTDLTGKYNFEGKFIEYKNSMAVILRKDNQKIVEVKLAQLSRKDGDWVRAELKARKEKAEAERKAKSEK